MAQPAEDILIIATEDLGADGFVSKSAPTGLILTEGFSKQSLSYQKLNYMQNNFGNWLKYINEEQIPDADQALQDQIDTINTTGLFQSDVGTSNGDILAVGDAFGLGSDAVYVSDCDNISVSGLYRYNNVTLNTPDPVTDGSILVIVRSDGQSQLAFATPSAVYFREDDGAGFGAWNKLALNSVLESHTSNSNPHSDSQATSDWAVTSGDLSDGATVPIPAGFSLGDCHITLTQSESYTGDWDLQEGVDVNHYKTICRVVGGVVDSKTRVYDDIAEGYQTFSVGVHYLLVARKGTF